MGVVSSWRGALPSGISRRSPYLREAAASTAPARLAEQRNGSTRWRPAADGGVEIAGWEGSSFRRHHVDEDGTLTLLETREPPRLDRRISRVLGVLWLVGLAATVADGTTPHLHRAWVLVMVATIVVVSVCVAITWVIWKPFDVRGWKLAPELSGWQPVSTAQLQSVEELSDAHAGRALLRAGGSSTVEVLVQRHLRLRCYWVDATGASRLVNETAAGLTSLSRRARILRQRGEGWLVITTREPNDG
jgi:hypothetical protein